MKLLFNSILYFFFQLRISVANQFSPMSTPSCPRLHSTVIGLCSEPSIYIHVEPMCKCWHKREKGRKCSVEFLMEVYQGKLLSCQRRSTDWLNWRSSAILNIYLPFYLPVEGLMNASKTIHKHTQLLYTIYWFFSRRRKSETTCMNGIWEEVYPRYEIHPARSYT